MQKIGFLLTLFLISFKWTSASTQLKVEIEYENELKMFRYTLADGLWDSFEEVEITDKGWSYKSNPSRIVEFWEVDNFNLEIKGSSLNRVLDLAELIPLQQVKIPAIESVHIDIIGFKGEVDINLEEWNQYESWKYLNIISAFGVHASDYSDIQLNLNALRIFDLFSLIVPMQVGSVLDAFPNLGILHARGLLTAFTHQIYQLDQLEDMKEYDPVYSNAFETLHAERYYFFQCSNLQEQIEFPNYMSSGYLDDLFIETQDTRNAIENGEFLILENDHPNFTGKTIENDTLFHGYRENNKHVGIHTFKIRESYSKNDREKFQIDFSNQTPPKFDRDGLWQFHYVNGNVAIEGTLRNRKKIGDWKFYEESGNLRTVKTFDNDTLKRAITRFELHGDTCESRTYYLQPYECVQSFTNVEGTQFQYLNLKSMNIPGVTIQKNSIQVLDADTGKRVTYRRGKHENFEEVYRQYVVDLLFPEFIGQPLPFKIE